MVSNQAEDWVELSRSRSESNIDSIQPPPPEEQENIEGQVPIAPTLATLAHWSALQVANIWRWVADTLALLSGKVSILTSIWRQCHSAINTTGAVVAILALPLTVLATWAAWAALQLSQWTKRKDELQWCEDHDWKYPGCDALKDEFLPLPRGFPTSTDESRQDFVTNFEPLSLAQRGLESPPNGSLRLFCIIGLSMSCLQLAFLWTRRHLMAKVIRDCFTSPVKDRTMRIQAGLPVKHEYKAECASEMEKPFENQENTYTLNEAVETFEEDSNRPEEVTSTLDQVAVPYSSETTATSRKRWTIQSLLMRKKKTEEEREKEKSEKQWRKFEREHRFYVIARQPSATVHSYGPPSSQGHPHAYLPLKRRRKSKKESLTPTSSDLNGLQIRGWRGKKTR